jgi:hypothetical protein
MTWVGQNAVVGLVKVKVAPVLKLRVRNEDVWGVDA